MPELTLEQKAQALDALAEISLKIRDNGDWYVLQDVEIGGGGDGTLLSVCGDGPTPAAALLNHWDELTSVSPRLHIVTDARSPHRAHWRWNGFMWREILS